MGILIELLMVAPGNPLPQLVLRRVHSPPFVLPLLPKIPSDGKRCNARMRVRRGYCRQKAMSNGRCRLHGGLTTTGLTNIRFMEGKTSKHQYLPPALISRYEAINGDALDNLEESIKVQVAMETRLHDQLATGESFQAWQLLKELIPDYEYTSNPDVKEGVFNRMKHIINGGIAAYGVRKDIQSIHESQRKLTETLVRSRKEIQETWTQEQFNELLNTLLNILRVELDSDSLRRVAMAIQAAQRPLLSNGGKPTAIMDIGKEINGNIQGLGGLVHAPDKEGNEQKINRIDVEKNNIEGVSESDGSD